MGDFGMHLDRKTQILIASVGMICLVILIGFLIADCKLVIGAVVAGVGTSIIAVFSIITNHKIRTKYDQNNKDDMHFDVSDNNPELGQ
jgi:hypothetical protein